MKKRIPIGLDNFAKLTDPEQNYLFIDKSLMIKELMDLGDEASLILRPRRWGKSMNMSMLRYFFAPTVLGKSTKAMFDNLAIAQINNGEYIKKYQGKHPVLMISFKDVKELDLSTTLGKIALLIRDTISEFSYIPGFLDQFPPLKTLYDNLLLEKASSQSLQESFKLLSECLYRYYDQKVVIIIDEYDTPINAAYSKPELFNPIISFFRGFFGASLKGNYALEKGIMTGILRLSKNNILSDLNNLRLYSMSNNEYSSSFGFFENDIISLFQQSNIIPDLNSVKTWYNGYSCGEQDGLYNPWSILNYIANNCKLAPYWIKTGNDDLLRDIFLNASSDIKEKLQTLIAGGSVSSIIDDFISFEEIKHPEDPLIWSALWALGYLKITKSTPSSYDTIFDLAIPNHEIDYSYRKIFLHLFHNLGANDSTYQAILSLADGNIQAFSKGLKDFLLSTPSYHDLTTESHYHLLVLGMLSVLKEHYNILSNRESGLGRFDISLTPLNSQKDLAIIIEFKKENTGHTSEYYQQKANIALNQILNQKYYSYLNNHKNIKQCLFLSLIFHGKDFSCSHTIHNL